MMRGFASTRVTRILFLSTAAVLVSCVAQCLGHSEDETAHTRSSWCPNAFFNFGDSLSDTGNKELAMPGASATDYLPYGEAFFERPTGRSSNGRLVIDFVLLAFKLPLLYPHRLPSHQNDRQGLNFAYAGATARPDTWHPFPLNYQLDQFIKLKNQVLQAQREQSLAQNLNKVEQPPFSTALYTICIGGNDLMGGIFAGLQPKAILHDIVPGMIYEIVSAVEVLYLQGGRKFLVYGGPPLGCSTVVLSFLDGSGLPVDNMGCITAINEINQALNSELFKSVQRLRASLPNVTITYFDFYAANIEILENPSKYGFNPDVVYTACCGAPGVGTLNFNFSDSCGTNNFSECDNPDEYLIWDGIHWTEAFYRHIALFVLNGKFSDPSTNLTKACDLTFEAFGHTTFEEIFVRSSLLSFE